MSVISAPTPAPEALPDLPVERGYELIDGQPVEIVMGAAASRIAVWVGHLLLGHVVSRKAGHVFGSECGYQIFKKEPMKVRKPDVSFIASGRLPGEEVPEGHMRLPPDLAVEVISPNDLAQDVEARVNDYLGAGARLMWLLYPVTRSVWVVRQDGSAARLQGEQVVSGEDVLPDFSSPVSAFVPAPPG